MPTATKPLLRWLTLGALTALGCEPEVPPEDLPEVEVSGGELPEYDYDAAELEAEEQRRETVTGRRR